MLFIIAYWIDIHSASFMYITEVGIYKRKQELDQETEQEKQQLFLFFLDAFLVESVFSFFFLLS